MASNHQIMKTRDRLKQKKAGRDRKKALVRNGTTSTKEEFFAGISRDRGLAAVAKRQDSGSSAKA